MSVVCPVHCPPVLRHRRTCFVVIAQNATRNPLRHHARNLDEASVDHRPHPRHRSSGEGDSRCGLASLKVAAIIRTGTQSRSDTGSPHGRVRTAQHPDTSVNSGESTLAIVAAAQLTGAEWLTPKRSLGIQNLSELHMSHATYKDAGVDLELYEQAMQRLPALMKRTHTPRVMDLPGGFAGLFRLNAGDGASQPGYKDPVMVSGTDGVGTKIKVATLAGVHNTIGIDLVGMCVNDCLCLGAEPLFFLDYLALGKDNPDLVANLVEGVSNGCVEAGTALLGGETAIMPDLYAPGDFDLAGFCVGVVERSRIVDGSRIQPDDVLLGMASSGFHSNGYSLIRKVVFERAGLSIGDKVAELQQTVGDALLTPTRIYAGPVGHLRRQDQETSHIHGMAHITGGGLGENIERILPENCRVVIQRSTWDTPAIFSWLQKLGDIEQPEMEHVFNMGIGYVLIVAAEAADAILQQANALNVATCKIGAVHAGNRGVELID